MKLALSCLLCILSLFGFSQIKTGIQLSYNMAAFTRHDIAPVADYYLHTASRSAFNTGVISSAQVGKRWFLQPSLLLSEKGAKKITGGGFTGINVTTYIRLYYAHIPVSMMYTLVNGNKLKVLAGAGVYIAKGIWGNEKGSYNISDSAWLPHKVNIHNKVKFTNDLNDYKPNTINIKPWDAGYNIVAEANWNNFELKASYDFGLSKVMGTEHRNRIFSVSAGYYFSKKKK